MSETNEKENIELQEIKTQSNGYSEITQDETKSEVSDEKAPLENNPVQRRRNNKKSVCDCAFFFLLTFSSFFTFIRIFYSIKQIQNYDNFYDSSCYLKNITINSHDVQRNSVIFSFVVNHDFKNFTTEVEKLCSKYQPDCPMYETDWFSCKLVENSDNTYSFETDRGNRPIMLLIFFIIVAFIQLLLGFLFFFSCLQEKLRNILL